MRGVPQTAFAVGLVFDRPIPACPEMPGPIPVDGETAEKRCRYATDVQ